MPDPPLSREREDRRRERDERTAVGAQLMELRAEIQDWRAQTERRFARHEAEIRSAQAENAANRSAIERIDGVVLKQVAPAIKSLTGQISGLAEESRLTRQGYAAQTATIAMLSEEITGLRQQYLRDHREQGRELAAHRRSESVLTRAGLLVGGLWATTLGVVVFLLSEHIWPWLRAAAIKLLSGDAL